MLDKVIEILRDRIDRRLVGDDIEIVPDRQMPNIFAVRVSRDADYIVNEQTRTVESVRFDQWPPS
jgi:hypothetical protein